MSRQSTTEYRSDDLPECEIETNPDMPSPARVRWIDAFTRVCAQLSDVSMEGQAFMSYTGALFWSATGTLILPNDCQD